MQKKHSAVLLALGSNLGDRSSFLHQALNALQKEVGLLRKVSDFIETAPVGGPPQGDFLNAVCLLKTTHTPRILLQKILAIEDRFGRIREVHWGPRTLDIDILLFEKQILQEPDLVLPHPRLQERLFVLEPAIQIARDWVHPVLNRTLQELYDILKHQETSL